MTQNLYYSLIFCRCNRSVCCRWHTCRIWGRLTFPTLVEAVSCLFQGQRHDLSRLTQHEPMLAPSTP
jgi:hypothetical protein